MPSKPARWCSRCNSAHSGDCPKRAESRKAYDERRGSSTQRGYDYRWQQFRQRYLTEHPLCRDCMTEGRVTAATDVHHIEKLRDAPHRKYDDGNLLALCSMHHDQRTAKGE